LDDPEQKLTALDKIWRISSLTAFVDEDAKILVLPKPDSKRETKLRDTKYTYQKIGDILGQKLQIEGSLEPEEEEPEQV